MSRDFGDFQTPAPLVSMILDRLASERTVWERVLEPTVGQGGFVSGLLSRNSPPKEILGFEIQEPHLETASRLGFSSSTRIDLKLANLFQTDLRRALRWNTSGPLLVVGNPPWVTNAELGSLGSVNLPPKSNVKQDRGLDAMTGRANFDLAEAVWLKLIEELAFERPSIALLCKTSVARGVLEHAFHRDLPIGNAWIARIDAQKWFRASVDACLFFVKIDPTRRNWDRVPIYDTLESFVPASAIGFAKGKLVEDIDAYRPFARFDGHSPLQWRQGIKHDAADLMELSKSGDFENGWINKRGDLVDIESSHIFPLLKGVDLTKPNSRPIARSVIVTQAKVGSDTSGLAARSPKLWSYLRKNLVDFRKRKSSIYQNAPEFAMFGVGPYSFAPYKVAIAGLSKTPRFQAIGPRSGRPILFDDTCYFLPCGTSKQAAAITALLNSDEALGLIKTLVAPGAKRSITKTLLQRIDLSSLLRLVDRTLLMERANAAYDDSRTNRPDWPDDLETLLRPDPGLDLTTDPFTTTMESLVSWPSQPSIISAIH